jgi:hypothetical protein
MVVSTARFWWQCASGGLRITAVESAQLQQPAVGQVVEQVVEITATTPQLSAVYFPSGVTVTDIGQGVAVNPSPSGEATYTFLIKVRVTDNAMPGDYMLTITNDACSLATHAITIIPRVHPETPGPTKSPQAQRGQPKKPYRRGNE